MRDLLRWWEVVGAVALHTALFCAPWPAFTAGHPVLGSCLIALWFLMTLGLALLLTMLWIARGESDANGSPEKDAGLPWPADDEITPGSIAWDHGSARTARHSLTTHSLNHSDSHA